jgi:hypothetical protein
MSEHQYMNENAQLKARKPENAAPEAAPDVNDLVKLQSVVGNQGVQRLLAQLNLVIQPKLNVTAAGDKYEVEADTVAKQVVQQINQPAPAQREEEDALQMKRDTIQREGEEDELQMQRIQRAEEEDELQMQRDTIQRDEGGEMEEEELQMKRDTIQRDEGGESEDEELQMKRIQRQSFQDGGEVGGDFESSLESARGGGQSIDDGVRGKLEGAFGADFSGVRVHTDSQSDTLNKSIQAKAFTTGSDIFFSKGAYNPASTDGQELLSHELTHVVQQNGSVQKKQEE